MADNVKVRIGECQCPGAPHEDGDHVWLRPKLGLSAGVELQSIIAEATQANPRPPTAVITGRLVEAYLLHGVAEWTLVDVVGPIPVNRDTITTHLLSDFGRSQEAASVADDLYFGPVISPLVEQAQTSLRAGSTNGRTSQRNGKAHKPSKRSSTTTTPTGATGKTSR